MTYKINDKIFNTLNPQTAYWLGFIAADGYLTQRGNLFGIGLNKRDTSHLEAFRKFIGSNHKLEYRTSTDSAVIRITDKKVKDAIRKWLPGKSIKGDVSSLMEKIPDDFKSEFIAGYFDGDGSVFAYKVRPEYKDKIYDELEGYAISIVGNWNTLSDIGRYLVHHFNFSKMTIVKNDNVYRLDWRRKRDIQEFHKVYEKSPQHLQRKEIKYNYVLEKLKDKKGRNKK